MELHAAREFRRRRREKVFASFADPGRFETFLRSVAGEVQQVAIDPPRWQIALAGNFGIRQADVGVVIAEPGRVLQIIGHAGPFDALANVVFEDIVGGGCRADARLELTPKTLAARLTLQTLRLGRKRIEERMAQALQALGRPLG